MRTADQPDSSALSLLNYLHPPIIAILYCSLYIFRGATPLGIRRRGVTLRLMLLLTFSYLAEALYYAYLQLSKNESAPKYAIVHVLSAISVWMVLTIALFTTSSPLWQPYAGTFFIESLCQAALCVTNGLVLNTPHHLRILHLGLSVARTTVSLRLLSAIGRTENYTNEEMAPLLGTSHERGNWVSYLQRYAIFLPYLWPKEVKVWFAARIVIVILGRVTNFAIPQQEGILLDLAVTAKRLSWKSLVWWIALQLLALGCKHGDDWASTRIQASSYQKLTNMALSHTLSLSWNHLLNENTGELVKAGDQAQSLNSLIELICFEICPMIFDLVLATSYMGHAFGIHVVFIVLALALVYGWLGVVFATWANPIRREWTDNSRKRYQIATECISLHPTISYFNRVEFELDRYKKAVGATMTSLLSYSSKMYTGQAIQGFLVLSGYLLAATVVLQRIASGQDSIGTFVTFIRYWNNITGPVKTITRSYQSITSMLVDAERLLQLLGLKSDIVDPEPARKLVIKSGEIRFTGVHFAYKNREPLFQGVSIHIKPGSKVAFVGETGSGKSTILKLLFRFYDVNEGSITIDGQDIRSVTLRSLREALGIVPQMPALFDKSIIENIRYGGLEATYEEVVGACKAAAIHKTIMSLPDQYNTKVGELGGRLSGGELQRIAIARVVLKNPPIIMLDEATSALDTETEASVQECLSKVFEHRTTLVVAHRLSTVVGADTILVMKDGEIVEHGTHDELLVKGVNYRKLLGLQTPEN
jgi:ABC-type transport system involved in Fe-S cluster assembly fused permease/ATPase subunit